MQLTKPVTKKPSTLATQARLIAKATAFYANDWREMSHSYDEVDYTKNGDRCWITCLVHNIRFKQELNNHCKGSNDCPECPGINGKFRTFYLPRMIRMSIRKHGAKYDYSGVAAYKPDNVKAKFMLRCIPCDVEFETTFDSHLYHDTGCILCANRIKGLSNAKKLPLAERNLANTYPLIAAQLRDPTMAANLKPSTHSKVAWVCPNGHADYNM